MTENERSKCQTLLSSLSDYVDGTVGDELCEEINRHLSECNNCRVVVDTLRRTITLYHDSADATGIPGEVRERLYRTLNLDDYIRH
jgi:predicted anti-sigma-YlaC factor YlaD